MFAGQSLICLSRKLASKVRVLEKTVKANLGGPGHEATSIRTDYLGGGRSCEGLASILTSSPLDIDC